jgi:uncharacterized repeat protein (TIGR03833 family)
MHSGLFRISTKADGLNNGIYLRDCKTPELLAQLKNHKMDGTTRANIKPGMQVLIVLKKDQRTGKLTEGIVKDLLTSAPTHHRGIKVRLQDGQIGRVQEITEE